MKLTTDPDNPLLGHGIDNKRTPQNKAYLILEEDKRKLITNKVRTSYEHVPCGTHTEIPLAIAETFAVDPKFYSSTYCAFCEMHRPVGEFVWSEDNKKVGS